jgi:geranylgeranyl pyrophosphate synthase
MSEPAKDFDLEHWKEVCYAHEAELEWLRADVKRMREALVYISDVCIRHDQGNETGRVLGYIADNARAALDPYGQKERRAKALSELAEMDADLLDIDPEVKP